VVEEPPALRVVAALVEVEHHEQLVAGLVAGASARDTGLQQRGQIAPHGVRRPVDLTDRPQDPVADLVADRGDPHVARAQRAAACRPVDGLARRHRLVLALRNRLQ
jgi:hypothetical protein